MAKDDIDLDDFDFDDFDLPDLPGEGELPKDDRKPVTKVSTGFVEGVTALSTDENFLRRAARDSLPDGYKQAFDAVDKTATDARGLYNSAVREVRPAMRDIKRASRRLMPRVERYLPEKVRNRINDAIKDEDEKAALSAAQMDQETIASSLAAIFDAQREESREEDVREETEKVLQRQVDTQRFETTIDVQEAIHEKIGRLVSYQDSINANYQKKSLELQYRHYFAARDLLGYFKGYSEETKSQLAAITKNTALPDYRKMELAEVSGQMLRDKLVNRAHQSVADYTANFQDRLVKNIQERIKRFGESFRDAASMAADFADLQADMEEMGVKSDPLQSAGGMGGSFLGARLGEGLGRFIRGRMEKSERLNAIGQRAGYLAENRAELLNEWAGSSTASDSPWGGVMRFIKDVIPQYQLKETLDDDLYAEADKDVAFNRLTRQSITEVIPGYLSRIHHELAIMRTGDASLERVQYNVDRQRFTSSTQVMQDTANRLLSSRQSSSITDSLEEILKKVDPSEQLSEEAKRGFVEQILRDTSKHGYTFSPERYMKDSGLDQVNEAHREEIRKVINESFLSADGTLRKDADTATRIRSAAKQVRALQSQVPNLISGVDSYAKMGNRETLEALGLLVRDGNHDRIDYDNFWKVISSVGPHDDTENQGDRQSPLFDRVHDDTAASSTRSKSRRSRNSILRFGGVKEAAPVEAPKAREQVKLLEQINRSVSEIVKVFRHRGGSDGKDTTKEDKADSLTHQIQTYGDHIVRAVNETSVKLEAGEAVGLLSDILAELQSGSGPVGGGGGAKGILGKVAGKARRGASKILSTSGKFYQKAFGGLGDLTQGMMGFGGGALTFLGNKLRGKRDETTEDVYVKGRAEPALLAWKMELGHYKDQVTGKVIKSIEDLKNAKGPIIDTVSNNRVVATLADLRKGLTDGRGKSLLQKGLGFIRDYYSKVLGFTLAPFKTVKSIASAAKRFIDGPKDVYVRGEASPRLLAIIMSNGGYRSRTTGKIISSVHDIDGAVEDLDGNVVLTAHQIQKGLVDRNGKPFKTMRQRISGLVGFVKDKAKSIGKFAKNRAKEAWELGKGVVKRGAGLADAAINRLKGGAGTGAVNKLMVGNRGNVKILKAIYDLLVDKMGPPTNPPDLSDLEGMGVGAGIGSMVGAAKEKGKSLMDRARGLFQRKGKPAAEKARGFFGRIKDRLRGVNRDQVKDTLKQKGTEFKDNMIERGSSLRDTVSGQLNDRRAQARAIAMELKDKVPSKNTILEAFNKITQPTVDGTEKLYELMKERLPKPKKKGKFDSDGDGVRDGSWQDIFASRKKGKGEEGSDTTTPAGASESKKGQGLLDNIPGMGAIKALLGTVAAAVGGSILGKLRGFFGGGRGADVLDAADMLDGDGRKRKDRKPKGRRPKGKRGMLRTLWQGAKKGTKGAGRLAKRLVRSKGARFAGRLALHAGRTALMAAAGTVSAPVVIGAAAVAAVGIGGYLLYKHMSKKKLSVFEQIRFWQYGINPDSEKEQLQKIVFLEQYFKDKIKVQKDGEVKFPGVDQEESRELLEGFGIDPQDEQMVIRWDRWFSDRFKPVFCRHMQLAHVLGGVTDPNNIDKIDKELKLKYLDQVDASFEPFNPYGALISPFKGIPSLDVSPVEIRTVIAAAREELAGKTEGEQASKDKPTDNTSTEELSPEEQARKERHDQMRAQLEARKDRYKDVPRDGVVRHTPGTMPDDGDMNGISGAALHRMPEPSALNSPEALYSIDNVSDDERIRRHRRALEAEAARTETQAAVSNQMLGNSMAGMVSVLTQSHGTQRSMDQSLKSMNRLLQAMYDRDSRRRAEANVDISAAQNTTTGRRQETYREPPISMDRDW